MWDKIKKAINSNLAKPLDTFMTEQFASWATQRGRLDVAISSRASQTSADLIKAKTDLITAGMGGIKSVQRGKISLGSPPSHTITISSVNPSKAFIASVGIETNDGYSYINQGDSHISAKLISSTQLVLTCRGTFGQLPAATWEIVEFY